MEDQKKELYTIKEASELLGYTRQQIIYAVDKLESDNACFEYIENVRYLSDETLKELKEHFAKIRKQKAIKEKDKSDKTSQLKIRIITLEEELENKNKQINNLMKSLPELTENNKILAQTLEKLAEENQQLNNLLNQKNSQIKIGDGNLTDAKQESKPKMWEFWKKRKAIDTK